MSWVVGYAFDCDLDLEELFGVLDERTRFSWRMRDSDLWGDYVSATIGADVVAKIFIEGPGYLLELKFQDDSLRDEWSEASRQVIDEILPYLDARDILRAPANN